MKYQKIRMAMVVIILALGLREGSAQASGTGQAAQFYRGKTITWVVSSAPGGSDDLVTRILVPHLARETGAKMVLVKNMPGGGVEGSNWVYNQARKDGLTLLTDNAVAMLLNDLLKLPGVKYNTSKYLFVSGVAPTLSVFAVSPGSPYKTLDALRKAKGLKVGASSAKGYMANCGAITLEIMGLDGRVVTGYKGLGEVILAVAQGEVDAVASDDSMLAQAEKQGNLTALFIVSDKRSPFFPNLPTMRELGVTIPKGLLDAYYAVTATTGRAIALPPGVPEDRVLYLREIFKKIGGMKDVERDITRWARIWRPFIPGEEMQKNVTQLMANKSLASQLEGILKKYTATK